MKQTNTSKGKGIEPPGQKASGHLEHPCNVSAPPLRWPEPMEVPVDQSDECLNGIAFPFFCLFGRETIQQYPAYCCILDMRCISSIVSYCFIQEFTDFFGPTVPPIGTLGQTFRNTATVSMLERPLTRLLRYTHLNFPSGPNTRGLLWMVAKSFTTKRMVETIYSK